MKNSVYMIAIAFLLCGQLTAEFTPDDLIKNYQHNQEDVAQFIIHSEAIIEAIDSNNDNIPTFRKESAQLRRDNSRYDLISNHWKNINKNDTFLSPEQSAGRREIWNNEKYYSINLSSVDNIAPNYVSISDKADKLHFDLSVGFSGMPLLGVLSGDTIPVWQIIQNHSEQATIKKTEYLNDVHVYVLSADTKHGEYTLWFSPDQDFQLVKAIVHKRGDDYIYGESMTRLLGPVPENMPPQLVKKMRDHRVVEFSFSMENIELKEQNGFWVPTAGTYEYTSKYATGRVITEKVSHKRTKINLKPDFESVNAFIPDIENGTVVLMDGFENVPLRWLNGKPVANIDEQIIESIDEEMDKLFKEQRQTNPSPPDIENPETKEQAPSQSTATKEPPLQVVAETPAKSNVSQSKSYSWLYILLTVAVFVVALLFLRLRRRAF